MGPQMSNHLSHYAEITTIHGIKDLVLSRSRVLRLAWSLCLMATMGLLCWYTYETVKVYLSGPTRMISSTVRLETYPPIHFCTYDWVCDCQYGVCEASSYNFTHEEVNFIISSFLELSGSYIQGKDCTAGFEGIQSTKDSIKAKMEQHNLSSVGDMMSIVSWSVSVESEGSNATTQKRWLATSDGQFPVGCQSISNVNRNRDLEIWFPQGSLEGNFVEIVVGEDFFGEKVFLSDLNSFYIFNVEIQDIKKRVLLNRPGFECTHHYDSAQACLLDCKYKREVCTCNGTTSITSYDDSESFWLLNVFADHHECPYNSSCNASYDYCSTQCKPCITWMYDYILTKQNDNDPKYNQTDMVLRFTKVPQSMEVTEQAYSYTASSLLSYIGGLLGLFCGASVLSFVQAFLFWWGDACHIRKKKVKEPVTEDIAKQDNIQSWVEQAALHIPHCKLCSAVTAMNIQSQISEEAQISQSKTNHLANYANNTTIHGIQDFLSMKNKFLKLVWGLFLLVAVSIMCEEIYRTVMSYVGAPTATTISIIPLDTYPTIHVCSDTWYNDTQARSYGFTQKELAFIRLAFQKPERPWDDYMGMKMKSIDGNNTAFEEQKKSVQLKMEQHNLKTVRDMLNLITWNISIQGQEFVTSTKRWRGRVLETKNSTYVCHTVSNASAQHDLSITLPEKADPDEFIVVGEDPFAESIKYGYSAFAEYLVPFWISRQITLKIWDINKRSLLGKDGTCNKGYNSFGVCLQDCTSQKDLCSCNGTMKIASYENNEDFFLLASRHDCRDDAGCNQNYDRCVEICEPCTTWDYQVTTQQYDPDLFGVPLKITMIPLMKVSKEYYTFLIPSLLSNIGGLMGVFCGASVLSLVHLLLFWWDDGYLLSKTKRTKKRSTEDHNKAWLQQAALRIPQCNLCKELTSTRTQNKQGGEVKTSKQKGSHLVNYAENTSIHGIKDLIFCKNKLIKLAWGLMLLIVFCLMCEEIYRTVREYASSPTDIDVSIILMDKYPPVHICVSGDAVYDDAQARSYGFKKDEIGIIQSVFRGNQVKINDTQRVTIKRKMEQHNLSTVQDMLNIVTTNLSIAKESILHNDPAPQKRWWREDYGKAYGTDYVCYTFSNLKVRGGSLFISSRLGFQFKSDWTNISYLFVVIGEDPFALRSNLNPRLVGAMLVETWIAEGNQLSLINRVGNPCSHDYNSSEVCIQDCVSKESTCNSSYPTRLPSYKNKESFWLFVDPVDNYNTSCRYSLEECKAKCILTPPCTTWTYKVSTDMSEMWSTWDTFLKLNMNPNMIVSQQYYTYPASSLLANIGGLVSLFYGGSLLSIVQVILFLWGDGCCGRKGMEGGEETTVVPEDDIHKWIQHAALHLT